MTFMVLCALLYLVPAPVQASSTGCSADYAHTMGDCNNLHHYQGECTDCDTDAWLWAIAFCENKGQTMLEYFCDEWHFEFVCMEYCPN